MDYEWLFAHSQAALGLLCVWFKDLRAYGIRLWTHLKNDHNCPLLNLSNCIFTTSALNIRCSISIVHQCSGNCTILEEIVAQTHEREEIQHKALQFKHNWSSPLYCYNAFGLI